SSEITVTQQAKKVVARSVQVDTPGTLRELLGAEFKDVEELTITGKINGNDIETLRLIYHLQYLDISDVFILDGGGYFPYGSWGESERTVANTISADMFRYYDELHTIILPNSVISIGQSAFEGCTGLTSITLPNSVTTIGYRAFRSCTGLTSISIGSGIKEIGGSAFENCNNIKEIHIRAVTPPYGSGGMPYKSTIKLYIPKGSKEAYEKVWDWEGFYQYIEE
ncbi:MAG TPA: hypothetical protein DDZ78_08075, partial [Porphyromonadaceae bacterium]|nr:hypothetical protein [Porphyromonadaceae bacterium]